VSGEVALGDLLGQHAEAGERVGDEAGQRQRERQAQHGGDAEQHEDRAPRVAHDPLGAGEVARGDRAHLAQRVERPPAGQPGAGASPSRARSSTTARIRPRRLATPRTWAGAWGTRVMSDTRMTSRTWVTGIPNSSRSSAKVSRWSSGPGAGSASVAARASMAS